MEGPRHVLINAALGPPGALGKGLGVCAETRPLGLPRMALQVGELVTEDTGRSPRARNSVNEETEGVARRRPPFSEARPRLRVKLDVSVRKFKPFRT